MSTTIDDDVTTETPPKPTGASQPEAARAAATTFSSAFVSTGVMRAFRVGTWLRIRRRSSGTK